MLRSKPIKLALIVVPVFLAFVLLVPMIPAPIDWGCTRDWYPNRASHAWGYGCPPGNSGYESVSLRLLGVGSSYMEPYGPGQPGIYTLYSWTDFWPVYL